MVYFKVLSQHLPGRTDEVNYVSQGFGAGSSPLESKLTDCCTSCCAERQLVCLSNAQTHSFCMYESLFYSDYNTGVIM